MRRQVVQDIDVDRSPARQRLDDSAIVVDVGGASALHRRRRRPITLHAAHQALRGLPDIAQLTVHGEGVKQVLRRGHGRRQHQTQHGVRQFPMPYSSEIQCNKSIERTQHACPNVTKSQLYSRYRAVSRQRPSIITSLAPRRPHLPGLHRSAGRVRTRSAQRSRRRRPALHRPEVGTLSQACSTPSSHSRGLI